MRLQKTKDIFQSRRDLLHVAIERQAPQILSVFMQAASSGGIEITAPNWAKYFRVKAVKDVYVSVNSDPMAQSLYTSTNVLREAPQLFIFGANANTGIIYNDNLRSLNLLNRGSTFYWATVEFWGEDDL